MSGCHASSASAESDYGTSPLPGKRLLRYRHATTKVYHLNASAQCWATRLALSELICSGPRSSCAARTGDRPAQSGRSVIVGPAFHSVETVHRE